MKIVEKYSHLNGFEFIMYHKKDLWQEIENVISIVNAEECKTKISKEQRIKGKLLYSPDAMNKKFKENLSEYNWAESRVGYWVTKDERLIRKTLTMPPELQRQEIESQGEIVQ
jgi:hypothetical protein